MCNLQKQGGIIKLQYRTYRSHRFSHQVLDALGYFGKNAVPTVFITSEFFILSVGEVLGYNLSIFIRAETGNLGIATTYVKRAKGANFANNKQWSAGSASEFAFTTNRVATKVRTYFEMRTDGQRFFV